MTDYLPVSECLPKGDINEVEGLIEGIMMKVRPALRLACHCELVYRVFHTTLFVVLSL